MNNLTLQIIKLALWFFGGLWLGSAIGYVIILARSW